MTRPIRRAFIGYRIADTTRYLDTLESQLVAHHAEREQNLEETRHLLQQSESDLAEAELNLQAFQAEYFRLSGELTTLTGRAQELIETAHQDIEQQENALWSHVNEYRLYGSHLHEAIQQVPGQLRSLIESLTDALIQNAKSPLEGAAIPRDSQTMVNDSPNTQGGNMRG